MEHLLSVTLLLAVLIALRYLLRGKIDLRLQYALWLLAAVRLLVPISLGASPLSVQNLTRPATTAPSYVAPAVNPTQGVDQPATRPTPSNQPNALPADPLPPAPSGNGAPQAAGPGFTPGQIVGGLWLTGAVLTGLVFLAQNLGLYYRLRRNRTRLNSTQAKRPVYLVDGLPSPCLFGLVHPAIYVTPACLEDPASLPYVLAHEETHYRHGDHIWSFVRCLCLALYWFHPLVWWAAILSRADCELACDQSAVLRLGDGHQKPYGYTLLRLAAGRGKPADLLCGATTMTASKSKLKERIVMLTNRPKMLLSTLLAVALIVGLTVGCTFTGSQTKGEAAPLTAEELAYFNGDDFFNGAYLNIRNMFLSSLYDDPKNINLFELFYNGTGLEESPVTPAEIQAYCDTEGLDQAPDTGCTKISRANMEQILTQYTGLTLAETNRVNLDYFTYLEDYDAYYNFHGDTNYRGQVEFYAGERQGELLHLSYRDEFTAEGDKVVTLRQVDNGYQFVSHQPAAYTREGSVVNPEGELPDTSNIPSSVIEGAKTFVQERYQYRLYNTGVLAANEEGQLEMFGELPVLDNWRVEAIQQVDAIYQEDGSSLEVYRLDYRLHTTTPETVVLAGGAELSEDGWWLDTYPGSTYLVFSSRPWGMLTAPLYLYPVETNFAPTTQAFQEDILRRYQGYVTVAEVLTIARDPLSIASEFFGLFERENYGYMQYLATPQCVETYFHEGDVFGLIRTEAYFVMGTSFESEPRTIAPGAEQPVSGRIPVVPAPGSPLYNGSQEPQEVEGRLILLRVPDGRLLVDRFEMG